MPKQRWLLFSPTPPKACVASQTFSIARHGGTVRDGNCRDALGTFPSTFPPPRPQFALRFAWMHTYLQAFCLHTLCCPALCPSCFSSWGRHKPGAKLAGTWVTHPAAPSLWGHSERMPPSCRKHSVGISGCFPMLRLKLPWRSSASGRITVLRRKIRRLP